MIRIDKDPTLQTLLKQEALKERGLYLGNLDNWPGPATARAEEEFRRLMIPVSEQSGKARDISADGIALIKHFEGWFPKAYLCPAKVWTIGYGHTGLKHKDGTVYSGRTITLEEGERLLRHDMDFFEERVSRLVTVPLNDDEYAALVSFDFNTGALHKSTLLKKLNAGDRKGAAEEFAKWNKANGRVLAGLTRRRKSERLLFLSQRPFLVK